MQHSHPRFIREGFKCQVGFTNIHCCKTISGKTDIVKQKNIRVLLKVHFFSRVILGPLLVILSAFLVNISPLRVILSTFASLSINSTKNHFLPRSG